MSSMTSPYEYDPREVSIMAACFVVLGVGGGILSSILLDKYQCYLKLLRLILVGSIISCAIAFWALPHRSAPIFCVNISLIGFFLLPIMAIGYSFCAELAYPNSDSLSSGMMMLLSQIFGVGVSYLATFFIEALKQPLAAVALFLGQFICSLLLSLVLKEDLRRLNAGKEGMKEIAADESKLFDDSPNELEE